MTPAEIIDELKNAVASSSQQRNSALCVQIADYFSTVDFDGDRVVALFDDLFGFLIPKSDRDALMRLSHCLAVAPKPLRKSSGLLLLHPDIEVSKPLLAHSAALADEQLIEIAKLNSKPHLLVMARYAVLSDEISELLLDRSDLEITKCVIANDKARISERGFARAISLAARSTALKRDILQRPDLPDELRPWLREDVDA
jgi:uncharacterized protein (DUF2336 family)